MKAKFKKLSDVSITQHEFLRVLRKNLTEKHVGYRVHWHGFPLGFKRFYVRVEHLCIAQTILEATRGEVYHL